LYACCREEEALVKSGSNEFQRRTEKTREKNFGRRCKRMDAVPPPEAGRKEVE
jgi:hypothetical protein